MNYNENPQSSASQCAKIRAWLLGGNKPTSRKTMKRRHEESELQRNCVMWFRLQYPNLRLNLFAVPNGGARTPIEGAIMKGEGVTAGVSDLILLFPAHGYHALCIEMKTAKGIQRPTQCQWQRAVEATGNKYAIVRSFDEFASLIRWYLQ